jgi:ssrA-binding protein
MGPLSALLPRKKSESKEALEIPSVSILQKTRRKRIRNHFTKKLLRKELSMAKGEGKVVAQNKKASHDYTIVDTIEAGMVLTGTEIKSVRAARINLKDGFAQVKNGEVWLSNVHIAPYEEGNIWNQDPERRRKLLLHKKQIQKLEQETKGTGMTLVPLKVYLKDGYAKLLLGLAKGKHDYDKRESIKRREQNRDIARVMKQYNTR